MHSKIINEYSPPHKKSRIEPGITEGPSTLFNSLYKDSQQLADMNSTGEGFSRNRRNIQVPAYKRDSSNDSIGTNGTSSFKKRYGSASLTTIAA